MGSSLSISCKVKPNFSPSQDKISSTLVWLRFLDVPIELFQEDFLIYMGNLLGRTVKVDPTTLSTSRGKFARVCIEINFRKPLVPLISVMGHVQAVEYVVLHSICLSCSEYGHRDAMCPKTVHEAELETKVTNVSLASVPASTFQRMEGSETANYLGPRIFPKNPARRKMLDSQGLATNTVAKLQKPPVNASDNHVVKFAAKGKQKQE